jgi:hypothetical protein
MSALGQKRTNCCPNDDSQMFVELRRSMEQCLVDLIFEPFKVSNEGWVRHVVLNDPECR